MRPDAKFFPKAAELWDRVRAGTFDRVGDRELSRAAGYERSGQFLLASQGRGKPMSYGHGSREQLLKETKGKG